MSQPIICPFCQVTSATLSEFCVCGARLNPVVIEELRYVDYLLEEIPKWLFYRVTDIRIDQELSNKYWAYRQSLIQTIAPPSTLPGTTPHIPSTHTGQASALEIDYLLGEIVKWQFHGVIDTRIQQDLTNKYRFYRTAIVSTASAAPPPIAPPTPPTKANFTIKTPDKPNIVSSATQPTSLNLNELADANRPVNPHPTTNTASPQPPIRPTQGSYQNYVNQPLPSGETVQTPANGGAGNGGTGRRTYTPPPLPPPEPERSFGETISENIQYIFAISAALFVGGIALYYRNELYYGLSQPLIQAILLLLITLGALVGGTFLVHKTEQSLPGRTMMLVGALLVPINPWLWVRAHLITDTGNSWVLALACLLLYASISYFLRDRLFVYLSLVTTIISGWAIADKFVGGAASNYAVVLMGCAIGFLLMEQRFKPQAEGVIFNREEFGKPFFHVAQVGIALTLLFYTPLIAFVPIEFVAAKKHFDPSYNSLVAIWLALASSFGYFYSSIIRPKRYFVYLAIATLFWAEISLLDQLHGHYNLAILVFGSTTLLLQILSQQTRLTELHQQSLAIGSKVVSWFFVLITFGLLVTFNTFGWPLNWLGILGLIAIASSFYLDILRNKSQESVIATGVLVSYAYLSSLAALHLSNSLSVILVLVPSYIGLWIAYQLSTSKYSQLSQLIRYITLAFSFYTIFTLIEFSPLESLVVTTRVVYCLELAGVCLISSYFMTNKVERWITSLLGTISLTVAYSLALEPTLRKIHGTEFLPLGFALWAVALYAVAQIRKVWLELIQVLTISSTVMVVILYFVMTGVTLSNNLSTHSLLATSTILTLVIIGSKEFIHLVRAQQSFHSLTLGLIGISLLYTLLNTAHLLEPELLACAMISLAITYLAVTKRIGQRYYQPLEWLANGLAVTALVLIGIAVISRAQITPAQGILDFIIYAEILGFFGLAAYWSGREVLGQVYAILTFAVGLIISNFILYSLGINKIGERVVLILPLIMLYILSDLVTKDTAFDEAGSLVAIYCHPIIILIGLTQGFFEPSTYLRATIFFAEITIFYSLWAMLKNSTPPSYLAAISGAISLWYGLLALQLDTAYFMCVYALISFSIVIVTERYEPRWRNSGAAQVAHITLFGSALVAVWQSTWVLWANHPIFPTLFTLTFIILLWILTSVFTETYQQIYRRASAGLSIYTYCFIGVYLGFDLFQATEFYGLPIGMLLLITGYFANRKDRDEASIYLWLGSLMVAIPSLLHSLQYRFILHESSVSYDTLLLVIALILTIGGMLLHFKAPTIVGGSGFILEMAVIIFSFVDWEQKWLSITMITLSLVIFGGSWAIYYFYKRDQNHVLQNTARNLMEEFGRWR